MKPKFLTEGCQTGCLSTTFIEVKKWKKIKTSQTNAHLQDQSTPRVLFYPGELATTGEPEGHLYWFVQKASRNPFRIVGWVKLIWSKVHLFHFLRVDGQVWDFLRYMPLYPKPLILLCELHHCLLWCKALPADRRAPALGGIKLHTTNIGQSRHKTFYQRAWTLECTWIWRGQLW